MHVNIAQEIDQAALLLDFQATFLLFLTVLALFVVFFYRLRNYHLDAPFLAAALALVTFAIFLSFIDSPLLPFVNIVSRELFFFLQLLTYEVAFILFYLHTEYNSNERPKTFRLLIMGGLMGILILSNLAYLLATRAELLLGDQVVSNGFKEMLDSSKNIMYIIAVSSHYLTSIIAFTLGAFNQWTASRGKDKVDVAFTIAQGSIAFEMLLLLSYELLNAMGFLSEDLKLLAYSITMLFVALSFIAYLILYIINPIYLYKVPVNVKGLILILPNGTPLAHIVFDNYTKEDEMDISLVSGFLNAISSFTQNILDDEIEQIKARNMLLLQKRLENHIVVAISSRSSLMFKKSFYRFVKTFNETMVEGNNNTHEQEYSNVAFEKAVKQIFPFLKVKEIKLYI